MTLHSVSQFVDIHFKYDIQKITRPEQNHKYAQICLGDHPTKDLTYLLYQASVIYLELKINISLIVKLSDWICSANLRKAKQLLR